MRVVPHSAPKGSSDPVPESPESLRLRAIRLEHGRIGERTRSATLDRETPPNSREREGEDEGLLLGLAGSMASLLAHGLVDNTLFFPDLALVFCLTLALVQRGRSSARAQPL